jgi:bifunctional ADP-heptose synthase (sugar kinase/adenylyltransferase)
MKISLPAFDDVRVLVVGALMLDQYWHCSRVCGALVADLPGIAETGV